MKFNIFENKKFNSKKLIDFGFFLENGLYRNDFKIFNNKFLLSIEIEPPNKYKTKLKEIETNEIYTLHLTDSEGTFVGKIRDEYEHILNDITQNCFDTNVFKSDLSYQIIDYVKTKYNDDMEYLWEKFPENAVARRKDNSKWYLAILTVKKNRLGFESDESVEVIDLRINKDNLQDLLNKDGFFPAYHMNKKSWITIILDGTVNIDEITNCIDKSYLLAGKK